jgi:hypothetical protein
MDPAQAGAFRLPVARIAAQMDAPCIDIGNPRHPQRMSFRKQLPGHLTNRPDMPRLCIAKKPSSDAISGFTKK